MKKMKRLLALILATAVLLTCVSVTAFAASYPLIMVDYDESSKTIVKGETGQIKFMVLPEYKNEKYHVFVYDSNGRTVGSIEKSYYNTSQSIRYFTININTDALDMDVGTYTAEYWLSFYSFQEWHDAPNSYTYTFQVKAPCTSHTFGAWEYDDDTQHIRKCVNCEKPEEAPHTWDNGQVTKPADCKEPGEKTFTCTVCGGTRKEATPIGDHTWGGTDCNKPQTCTVCGIGSGGPVGHRYDDNVDGTCNNCGVNRETVEARQVTHMFRMYNPNTGEHFYTGSEVEKGNLVAAGWHYEGIGFTFPANTGAPVHRLFQPSTGEHLYTMNEAEKNTLMANGWNYEGIAFNSAYNTEAVQHRLHNPNATVGAYHFTFSEVEKQNLINAGWEYQGIGWYSCWK